MARTISTDPITAANGFHALSDPTRVEIVGLLRGGERCACELMDAIGSVLLLTLFFG
jgi:DNA-binding transcriptional ArsR family regulator